MKKKLIRIGVVCVVLFVIGSVILIFLAQKKKPDKIVYGISYNVPYVYELGLNQNEVFDALIHDMGVRDFRMSAHWTLIEPTRNQYDFSWMDYDIQKAEAVGAHVIFGIGRRLPRWPECHVPQWARDLTWEDQKKEIREYITAVVQRYKNFSAITYWQVENEPYLNMFANEHCGNLDEAFLKEEIELVRSLDPTRPILVTDSGNLGTWNGAYRQGDAFGTSVYVYFWNPELGRFKTVLPPWFYRVKENIMALIHGKKETFLIELSLEPWLLEPVTTVSVETQYSRMDLEKFNEIIEKQYLWGGEWWYWLKKQGHPEMWIRGKTLFKEGI
jgi:hypothetical protein